MKYTEDDEYILESGKKIYANHGIIGISPDFSISEGSDGGFNEDEFTTAEKNEIATYMIGLWENYRKGGTCPSLK